MRESDLYKPVATWLEVQMKCYATGTNTGLAQARIDVVGLRNIGGSLSGRSEMIAVEVKAGKQPFGTAAGQALSYSVYADRCYLADLRTGTQPFTDAEAAIASHLRIGLLAIRFDQLGGRSVDEVLSAPRLEAHERFRLEVIEKLGFSQCTICHSLFQRGEPGKFSAFVQREGARPGAIAKAVDGGKGYMYWLRRAAEISKDQRQNVYHRRYVCADCVYGLLDGANWE